MASRIWCLLSSWCECMQARGQPQGSCLIFLSGSLTGSRAHQLGSAGWRRSSEDLPVYSLPLLWSPGYAITPGFYFSLKNLLKKPMSLCLHSEHFMSWVISLDLYVVVNNFHFCCLFPSIFQVSPTLALVNLTFK